MDLWDINCRLGRWPSANLLFDDVPGLLRRMDALGIARAVVSHADCLHFDVVLGNVRLMDMLSQASEEARERLQPCWGLVPLVTSEHGTPAELQADLQANDIRVARLYPRDNNYSLSSRDSSELLSLLARRRIVTLIDLEQTTWEEIDRVAETFPDLPIVACHVGYRGLRRFAGVLARHANVHVDLSFLSTHQALEWLVARIGFAQLLFGTGAPLADGGGAVTRLMLSTLPEAERATIGWDNLQRLLANAGSLAAATVRQVQWTYVEPTGPAAQVLQSVPIAACDVIDSHAHVGPWFNLFIPEPTPESMLRVMDRCGVRMAVVSATHAISTDGRRGNAEVAAMVRTWPDRFAGYAVFSPHEPGSQEDVERSLDIAGFVGIKIHPDTHSYSVNGPLYNPVWDLARRRGVPILTHTFADSAFSDPLQFDSIALKWPDVVILLGHSGVTHEGHRRAITMAQVHPNLYLELCGSYITGHWIRQMVAAVGPARVLYGSDFPFIELRYGLGRVVFAGLRPAEEALILGGNARRVLRLPPPT
jgi:predicted TIM-barrel fold metal-dependent hydrolase